MLKIENVTSRIMICAVAWSYAIDTRIIEEQ